MRKNTSGFSIVELLIVIVIIGILASITLVTYDGVTDRARDAQTISAVNQWAKGLQMYKAKNGTFPNVRSCLGDNYKYGIDQQAGSGYQCRQFTPSDGINSNDTFNALLAPYMSNRPSPSMQTAIKSSTDWYRGAYFNPTGGSGHSVSIDYTISPHSDCPPSNGGYKTVYTETTSNKFKICCAELGIQ